MVAEGYKETKIGLIPIEWEVVKIVEVLDLMTDYVANGSFASLRENTTVYDSKEYAYYVRLFDLRKGLGHNAQKYVDKATYDFLDKSFLEGNEILIANIGANVGESFLMPKLDMPSTLAPNMIELKLNYKKMTSLFCLNYLKSGIGLAELDKVIEGSGQPKINKTKLKTIQIPLPPLKEQEKIADILSTTDEKIDAIALQITKTEELKKALLQKLLSEGIGYSEFKDSELGKIPESWEVVKIVEILDLMTDYVANGSFASLRENTTVYEDKEYAYYVRLFDLRRGLGHNAQKYVDEATYNFLDKSFLEGNEILIANIGANVGESFLMPTLNIPATLAPNMIELKLNYEKMIPLFCFNYLKSGIGLSELDKVIEGSGQPKINKTKLKTIKIPLPPLQEQKQIAEILSTADEKLEVLRVKKQKYETLKKGLLQKLLSGEVRV